MVLSSHQPDFFPYMGYFYKMFQSDVFVFSDDVQFSKTGRHNYNEILTGNGPQRITLPIHYHAKNLNEIQIALTDARWAEKTLKMLRMEYGKAEHFKEAYPIFQEMFMSAHQSPDLASFNLNCIRRLAYWFGISNDTDYLLSSGLSLDGHKDERILNMCKAVGATVYYSGIAAKDYHVEENFTAAGVRLVYTDYQPIQYPQVGGRSAVNMSVIDYVLNCGFTLPKEWKKWENLKM